jgi:leucyl-tRNA synthetase
MPNVPARDFSPQEKLYVLVEFPYPSGTGLHIGHTFSFTGGDVYTRYQRMQGKNVLFPMGWDAFGLPTENYAIRTGRPPQEVTDENTATFRRQMESLGLSFDWDRMVGTTEPEYYRWTQWIFVKLFEKGLAHKQEMPINWCPSCKVGLANEEVVDGHCERCGAETQRRRISQWVVRITDYADRLLSGLEHTEFIEKVKTSQVNWIGRSEGARIVFPLKGRSDTLEVFSTRPDTLWGATFMVLAPEHPLVESVMDNPRVASYVFQTSKKSDLERVETNLEKTGVDSGLVAIHPVTGAELPVWISDFVLLTYGSGAIMAVPAHDERDYAFARKFFLPIVPVIEPDGGWDFSKAAYQEHAGHMINSGPLTGLDVNAAIPAAVHWLEENGKGKRTVSYHLRDWIFSRQHYWGEPIPMIYCEQHGWLPVPEDQLPVVLPVVEHYEPTDNGESPLANIPEFVNTTCPKCGGPARRETDTMPNWAGSDWYFLRFCDPHNSQTIAGLDKLRYWMPVDLYIGGDEHNTLHLLYSRFIYQFLYDIGAVPAEIPEPYRKRMSHGVILGPDGQRMSKSRGNVVVPDEYIRKIGADAVRCYLMFIGPFDATFAWNERALLGVKRFLDRFEAFIKENAHRHPSSALRAAGLVNRLAKWVGDDVAVFKFNTALAKMMETLNTLGDENLALADADLERLVKILAPFAPFLVEDCWQILGSKGSVHQSRWPVYDPALEMVEKITIAVQVNGKLRGTLDVEHGEVPDEVTSRAAALESVIRHLDGKQLIKTIYIPERTLNFVVK